MKKLRIDVGHRAVPRGYEPGYPARLDPAGYRDVAARSRKRVGRVLAALGAAAAAGGIVSAQESRKSREDEVLDVLRESVFSRAGHWFDSSTFEVASRPSAAPYKLLVPRIPITFGNSYSGVFDAGEAKRQARRLFEAYGVKIENDVVVTPREGRAVLDGFEAARKIGFKLRGGAPVAGTMGPVAGREPADTELSDAELAVLNAEGYKLHVADLSQYPVMDQDASPSMFAYLAGVIDFLNGATEGPKIDLGAVTRGWQERLAIGADDVKPPKGVGLSVVDEPWGKGWRFTLSEPGRVVIEIRHRSAPGAPAVRERGSRSKWRVLDKPIGTAGSPVVLSVPLERFVDGNDPATWPDRDAKPPRPLDVKLIQERRGQPTVEVDGHSTRILAPSTFDAALPFRIVIEADALRYRLGDAVIVSVMPK